MLAVDKIVTISLIQNDTRRESSRAELAKLSLVTDFFLAEPNTHHPEKGCFESHQTVAVKALAEGHKSVLVFEDDIKIRSFDFKQIQQINQFIKNRSRDFDVLYLGLIIQKMWFCGYRHIVRARGVGLHAYILSTRGMQKLATYQYQTIPIDKVIKHDFKCYSVYPIIAEQYPETMIKSDITPARLESEPIKDEKFWQENYTKQEGILWKYWYKSFKL